MKKIQHLIDHNILSTSSHKLRLTILSLAASLLSGCLITTPLWNQQFASHTQAIPIQAWTVDKNKNVKLECAEASHGGLYPYYGPTWHLIANISPASTPSYDNEGNAIYSVSRNQALPTNCWRQDPANGIWYTAIRATHLTSGGSTVSYSVFDQPGLICLATENATARNWFAWLSADCALTYSNSSSNVPYVIIRANA